MNGYEKIREALEGMLALACEICANKNGCKDGRIEMCGLVKEAKAALSAPPRNCDVGTADEQANRFERFCGQFTCPECTLTGKSGRMYLCCAEWAQMPYEAKEGGAE